MSDLAGLQRPEDAEAGAEGGHGQVADVVAGDLERTVDADSGLGVLGEGSEAIDLFENGEVSVGMLDGLKATEGLVVLVEALRFASRVRRCCWWRGWCHCQCC